MCTLYWYASRNLISNVCEEWMGCYLAKFRTVRWLCLEHTSYQMFGIIRNTQPLRKTVLVVENTLVSRLHILRLVRRLTNQRRIHYHSHRPNIYFKRMPRAIFIAINHFRRYVVRRSTNRTPFIIRMGQLRRQPKIANFHAKILVQEQIAKFQIAMNYIVRMHVFESLNHLVHKIHHFQLRKSLAPFDQFVQGLICAQLQQNIAVRAIFEEMLNVAYVLVLQRPMDLDLGLELLKCFQLHQVRFWNNPHRVQFLSVE
mmetsp:Transcript_50512/g.60914  ORF Transcript_50512/g.60914 Transcript_50512/m.60914 type:complete len:257 (+) Transcript_50512:735-1505(+)